MSTQARWQRLQDLFHSACELPESQRDAYVRDAAKDDPQLLDELIAMLAIEAGATSQLKGSVLSAQDVIERATTLEPGTQFGPWAIVRPIGQGGMGQVYVARRADGAFEREVALKLLAAGGLDRRGQAFFEVERHHLAQMHHPTIAQIHDAGTDAQGRPWLVMEYIEGERITTYCDSHALPLRQRIELFLRLCDGVQHAHQKGVVHRDIKPGNVLVREVDGRPVPCLIDFGIAAELGDSAQPAGTPGYMSPEQADPAQRGDSRSDIYALGALLFALLAGPRNKDGKSANSEASTPSQQLATLPPEQLQAIAQQRALSPKRLLRSLREDLNWIVGKAMQADPDDRYQSVSMLAADLRRYLDGQPVSAAPPRTLTTLRKFVDRHRFGVAVSAVLLCTLSAALAGTTLAMQKAEREAHRTQVIAGFLESILTSVDPDIAGDKDKALMLHVLDNATQRVKAELAEDPRGRIDVEVAIADSYTALGMSHKAIPLYEAAQTSAQALDGVGSARDLKVAQRLGTALVDDGRFEDSQKVFETAIAHAQSNPGTIPASMVADLQSRLSWTLLRMGKVKRSRELAQQAYDKLVASVPENDAQLLDAGGRLAIVMSDVGDYDAAIALLGDMIHRRSEVLGYDHPRTLSWRLSLAVFHLQKRDYAAGAKELTSMLDPVARQYGEDSAMLAMVHANLGGALRQDGKVAEAEVHYRYAYDFNLRHNGPDSPNTIMTRSNLANWLLDAGRAQESLDEQAACLPQAERVFGADNEVTAEVLRGMGRAQLALGQLDAARASLDRAMTIMTALYGDAEGPLARLREDLARLAQAEQATTAETPQRP